MVKRGLNYHNTEKEISPYNDNIFNVSNASIDASV